MYEIGIIHKNLRFYDKAWSYKTENRQVKKIIKTLFEENFSSYQNNFVGTLRLKDLHSIFIILAIGIVLSILEFIIEYTMYKLDIAAKATELI